MSVHYLGLRTDTTELDLLEAISEAAHQDIESEKHRQACCILITDQADITAHPEQLPDTSTLSLQQ